MEPKLYEYKTLDYKGKTIFGKMTMGSFNRIEKYFQEDEACFMFIDNGDFILRTPNGVLHFQSGDGLFAKCGNYYFENQIAKNNKKNNTSNEDLTVLISAYFYPEIVTLLFKEDIFLSTYNTDYDANKVIIDKFLSNFKENISFLLDNPTLVDETLLLSKLKEFLILLAKTENAPSVIDFVSSFFKPMEYDFKTIIESNLYASLSLVELATLCGTSLATFKRTFSSYYTVSPKKYILGKKIEKAKQLLLHPEQRITDIAYDCGFDTISTFNKNFKRFTNQSPSDFRKTHL